MLLFLLACSTVPIEDGAVLGPFTQVKTWFTSAFVAQTTAGVVLVDAGYDDDAAAIEQLLAASSLTLDDVAEVFVTHGHTDHTKALLAFPNARVWAHEDEVDLIAEDGPDGVEVHETVVDGQLVTIGELEFEVLHVPGHTAGNVCYLAGGVLLMGDTAMNYKDGTVGPAAEKYAEDFTQAGDELLALRDRLEPRSDEFDTIGFAHTAALTDLDAFWEMHGTDW